MICHLYLTGPRLYVIFGIVDQYLYAPGEESGNVETWNSGGSTNCQFLIKHVGDGVFTVQSRANGEIVLFF